jgi:electron transfer flavoprotein beta subunit
MRQIVLLKDIPNLSDIKIDTHSREPIIVGVKRKISEVDKRALEAALQLKEKVGGEIIALSMGGENTKTALLEALAMGADSVYIVNESSLRSVDTNATSNVLLAAIKKIENYDIIICGEMTLDGLSSQIGPRLAELLDIPLISYVKELDFDSNKITAIRDIEDVDEIVESDLPVLITVVREINEPRIPSLMNIMRAKRKPQIIWNLTDLGLSLDEVYEMSHVEILSVVAPKVMRKQIIIDADSIENLAKKLADVIIQEGVEIKK